MTPKDFELVGRIIDGGEEDLLPTLTAEQRALYDDLRSVDTALKSAFFLEMGGVGTAWGNEPMPGYIRERLDRERALFEQKRPASAESPRGSFAWLAILRRPTLIAGALALFVAVLTPLILQQGERREDASFVGKGTQPPNGQFAENSVKVLAPRDQTIFVNPIIVLAPGAIPQSGPGFDLKVVSIDTPSEVWTASNVKTETPWSDFRPAQPLLPGSQYRIEIWSEQRVVGSATFRTATSAEILGEPVSLEEALARADNLMKSGAQRDALIVCCSLTNELRLDPKVRALRAELSRLLME